MDDVLHQPKSQMGIPSLGFIVLNPHSQRSLGTDNHNELPAPGDTGIYEVSL